MNVEADQSGASGAVLDHAPNVTEGDAGDFAARLADWTAQQQQQQNWMWQQMQGFPLPYGNFVPNMNFGGGFLSPDWGEEEAQVGSIRQGTHEISDDEDDAAASGQDDQNVADGAPANPDRPQDGEAADIPLVQNLTADRVKRQLSAVKDADRVTKKVDPVVAKLLDHYLQEATAFSDMEKLTKQYPRVEKVDEGSEIR